MPVGNDLNAAIRLLTRGELVAIPTETVYGLAANALDDAAVVKIFEAKKRPRFNPLIVHVADWAQARAYVSEVPPLAEKLAQAFWPGPLTLLLPKNHLIPDLVTAGSPHVALRAPRHPLAQELLRALPFPLAAPSANPFGYISPTTAAHVLAQLGDAVSYILDGGPAEVGLESTIVGFDEQGAVLYRLGGFGMDELEAVAGPIRDGRQTEGKPQASGMLKSHYAPKTSLWLENSPSDRPEKTGSLRFREYLPGIPREWQRLLSPKGDLAEAARNLFVYLHELDQLGLDAILAERVPGHGLGLAINDRLERAQAIFKTH